MSWNLAQLPLRGTLSMVIPAHNEAPNMVELMTKACDVLPMIAEKFEIVLVDDGCTDETAAIAQGAMRDEFAGCLRVIRHEHKSGYGISVADGLRAASGDYIGFVDADLQFDLDDFKKLAVHLGYADLVTGRRANRADNWKRSVTSGVYNFLVRRLYHVKFRDVDCAMKIMRRSFLTTISPIVSRSATINVEMYLKARDNGLTVVQFPVPHYFRTAGVRSGGRIKPVFRAMRELTELQAKIDAIAVPQSLRSSLRENESPLQHLIG